MNSEHLDGVQYLRTYDDVRTAAFDAATYSSCVPSPVASLVPLLNFMDGQDHARMRRVLSRVLRLSDPSYLRQVIETHASDVFGELRNYRSVDLGSTIRSSYTAAILSSLFGFPIEVVRELIVLSSQWSRASDERSVVRPVRSSKKLVRQVLEERVQRCDIAADTFEAAVHSRELSMDEAVGMAILTVEAATETTASLIVSCLAVLDHDPSLRKNLGSVSSTELQAFVEEVLRQYPPLSLLYRKTTRPIALPNGGVPSGTLVALSWWDANRDEVTFPAADVFDSTRVRNPHLSFGAGPHYCLGAPIARFATRTFIAGLLVIHPKFSLAGFRQRPDASGMRSLPEATLVLGD